MAKFTWTAQDGQNKAQKGEMNAESREGGGVFTALARKATTPLRFEEKSGFALGKKRAKKITKKDLVVFTRQFATFSTPVFRLFRGWKSCRNRLENKSLGAIVGQVKSDVETGSPLSDALKRHPKLFDDLYVNLVAAGETAGVLDDILQRLAVYIEKNMKLKKKVKGALIYPELLLVWQSSS